MALYAIQIQITFAKVIWIQMVIFYILLETKQLSLLEYS